MRYGRPAQVPTSNGKAFLKTLIILHIALMMSVFIFSCVATVLVFNGGINDTEYEQGDNFPLILMALAGATVLGSIMGAFVISKKKVEQAASESTLGKKLNSYKAMHIFRMAILEGPAFFAIVAMLLTNEVLLLVLPLVTLAVMFTLIPKLESIAKALNLTKSEINRIQDDNDIIIGPDAH